MGIFNMKQYIKLNNETFEVKQVKGKLRPTTTQLRSLGDCYAKPSDAKFKIYSDWLKWYIDGDKDYIFRHFTIRSYNCMMFTLSIDVYDKTTDEFIGQLYITKTRQEFWRA